MAAVWSPQLAPAGSLKQRVSRRARRFLVNYRLGLWGLLLLMAGVAAAQQRAVSCALALVGTMLIGYQVYRWILDREHEHDRYGADYDLRRRLHKQLLTLLVECDLTATASDGGPLFPQISWSPIKAGLAVYLRPLNATADRYRSMSEHLWACFGYRIEAYRQNNGWWRYEVMVRDPLAQLVEPEIDAWHHVHPEDFGA